MTLTYLGYFQYNQTFSSRHVCNSGRQCILTWRFITRSFPVESVARDKIWSQFTCVWNEQFLLKTQRIKYTHKHYYFCIYSVSPLLNCFCVHFLHFCFFPSRELSRFCYSQEETYKCIKVFYSVTDVFRKYWQICRDALLHNNLCSSTFLSFSPLCLSCI